MNNGKFMTRFGIVSLQLLLSVYLISCMTVPVTERRQFSFIPAQTMQQLGETQYNEFLQEHDTGGSENEQEMVKRVGNNIAEAVESYFEQHGMTERVSDYAWEFNLIEDDAVNAWCMPGGKVAIYTGLLPVAGDESGLAVVMAHEIAHAVAAHGNERMSQGMLVQFGGLALSQALQNRPQATKELWATIYGYGAQYGALYPYSRIQEKEADRMGLIFMAMADYDPNVAVDFWKRMMAKKDNPSPPALLSTHPTDEERLRLIRQYIPSAMRHYRK